MFAADSKVLTRIAPVVRRVIIADPNVASARLLQDIMKSLGAREVVTEGDETRLFDLIREVEPGILFTERAGAQLDGEALTRKLRRSNLPSRKVPVIMVTAETTASSIMGARDCGVHEFLRKPFTYNDLLKRIDNVASKPRDWIEAVGYVGPDRRRFNSGEYNGPHKRKADKPESAADTALAVKDQALKILASCLVQFDKDPNQAVRAVKQQAVTLKALAIKTADARLAIAASTLEASIEGGSVTRSSLQEPIKAILALADSAPEARKA